MSVELQDTSPVMTGAILSTDAASNSDGEPLVQRPLGVVPVSEITPQMDFLHPEKGIIYSDFLLSTEHIAAELSTNEIDLFTAFVNEEKWYNRMENFCSMLFSADIENRHETHGKSIFYGINPNESDKDLIGIYGKDGKFYGVGIDMLESVLEDDVEIPRPVDDTGRNRLLGFVNSLTWGDNSVIIEFDLVEVCYLDTDVDS
ncbi:hypothetical protein ACFL1A_01735 [Patescibacteria group bacterium]